MLWNRQAGAILAMLAIIGCTSTPVEKDQRPLGYAAPKRIYICHGYGCTYRSRLDLTAKDGAKFRAILSRGRASPKAERAAISRAVRYYENRAFQATGIRDLPKGKIGASRVRGQMDCVDEATNTHVLLTYLAQRGLLRHHKVERNASRGFFVDGRYPHWTAVIRDPQGERWAVDSWYAPMGGAPDIMPMSEWTPRGYLGGDAPPS